MMHFDRPPAFGKLVRRAQAVGYWVREARDAYAMRRAGGRYSVTRADCLRTIFASDSLDDVERWIAARETE